MKPSSAKNKGRKLQQLVRDAILKVYKTLTPDDVRSTGMGQGGVDIQLSQAAKKLFPYSVECKNKERINIWSDIAQAEANKQPDTYALLVIKKNRTEAYAVVPLNHFMDMLHEKENL